MLKKELKTINGILTILIFLVGGGVYNLNVDMVVWLQQIGYLNITG